MEIEMSVGELVFCIFVMLFILMVSGDPDLLDAIIKLVENAANDCK